MGANKVILHVASSTVTSKYPVNNTLPGLEFSLLARCCNHNHAINCSLSVLWPKLFQGPSGFLFSPPWIVTILY